MATWEKDAKTPVREKYKPLIRRLAQLMHTHVQAALERWFDGVGDALMAASDRARDSNAQLRFIEAIQLVRSSRAIFNKEYLHRIDQGFADFISGRAIDYPFLIARDETQLSIMDAAEEEDLLTVGKMANRILDAWPETFYGLEQRLALVRGGRKLEPQDMPGGPIHLLYSFRIYVWELQLDPLVNPQLYKLFAKVLVKGLDELYAEFNQQMIAAGIFPNLRYVATKQPKSKTEQKDKKKDEKRDQPRSDAKDKADGGKPLGPSNNRSEEAQVVDTISKILESRRSKDPRFRNHPDINPYAAPREMADAEQVIDKLQLVQPQEIRDNRLPSADERGLGLLATASIALEHLAESRRQIGAEQANFFRQLDPNSVRANDLDVIETVGLLFEEILDENDLPNVVKALLSYLHTPYLKVGIIDNSFLVDPEHDARQLLNLLVHAGRYWVDDTDLRKGIYYPLKHTVDRILGEFRDDVEIFGEMLAELREKTYDLERKSATMEQRSRAAATGHDRLTQSREKARQVIEEHTAKLPLHEDLRAFFYEVWLERLSFMLLRNPAAEQSREWTDSVKVIETLLLPFKGTIDRDLMERFGQAYPAIRKYVEKALFSMGDFQKPKSDRMFKLYDLFNMGDRKAIFGEVVQKGEVNPEQPLIGSEEQKMIHRLESLSFGTWFTMEDNQGKQRLLRLSWLNPVSKHCMFVDQNGVQALMINLNDLAVRLCQKRAKILEGEIQQPFVGRALRKISNALSALTSSQRPSPA